MVFYIVSLLFFAGTALALPNPKDLKKLVLRTEFTYDIPKYLLDAIIQQESSYQVKAVNPKSYRNKVKIASYGLGQLTKDTAKWHCDLDLKNIYNPVKNINCAAKVLKWQLDRYNGNMKRAVAAYQWGSPCECNGKVYQQQLLDETRVCKKRIKNKLVPMGCKKRGLFWNQYYVDSVLKKRLLALTLKKLPQFSKGTLDFKRDLNYLDIPFLN